MLFILQVYLYLQYTLLLLIQPILVTEKADGVHLQYTLLLLILNLYDLEDVILFIYNTLCYY